MQPPKKDSFIVHAGDAVAHRVGQALICRVTERTIDSFAPGFLLPDWDADAVALHSDSLTPGCFDAAGENVRLSVHTWVVRLGAALVLIDTGIGNHKSRPGKVVFDRLDTPYLERLAAAGIEPVDVTHVFNTHLHTDHVGWNTRWDGERWVPTFPHAKYFFPEVELQHIANSRTHLAQVYADSVKPVVDAGLACTVAAAGETMLDGMSFFPTPGHTVGHMSIRLASDGEEALFPGDVMHHPIQFWHPEWNSVFCDFPEKAVESRWKVLDHAARPHATYFSSHFPESSMGRVVRKKDGFGWAFG